MVYGKQELQPHSLSLPTLSPWEVGAAAPQPLPALTEPQFAIALFSSVSGNDSCGVDTDAKYNDTDLCWGPLRRVDVYRIYLVSVLFLAQPFVQRRVLHSATLWLKSEVFATKSHGLQVQASRLL